MVSTSAAMPPGANVVSEPSSWFPGGTHDVNRVEGRFLAPTARATFPEVIMILILCPVCEQPVSDSAPACIHCGHPSPGDELPFESHRWGGSSCSRCGAPRVFAELEEWPCRPARVKIARNSPEQRANSRVGSDATPHQGGSPPATINSSTHRPARREGSAEPARFRTADEFKARIKEIKQQCADWADHYRMDDATRKEGERLVAKRFGASQKRTGFGDVTAAEIRQIHRELAERMVAQIPSGGSSTRKTTGAQSPAQHSARQRMEHQAVAIPVPPPAPVNPSPGVPEQASAGATWYPSLATEADSATSSSALPFDHSSLEVSEEPRPWIRFFARWVDIALLSVIMGVILGIMAPEVVEGAPRGVMNLVSFVTWVPVEAFLLSIWGTTPGKALLNVRLRAVDVQSRIPFGLALRRSVAVWIYGTAIGLPFVIWIAAFFAMRDLKKNGITRWDEVHRFHVEHGRITAGRGLAVAFVMIVFFGLIVLDSWPE
jgi:hypothetical protein